MNAAALDRYIAAEAAYNAAKARGASPEDVAQAVKDAIEEKRREQVLRSVGVDPTSEPT